MRSRMNDISPVSEENTNWSQVDGNKLKLVHSAADRLKALINIIEGAEKQLKIFFYMFEEDDIGTVVRDTLINACKRGVAIELIVDSFGSNGASKDFFGPFKAAGGTFAFFSPRFATSYFVRNHQKMVIADDEYALIGGFNIADQYFDQHEDDLDRRNNPTGWEDLGLVLKGSAVERLSVYYSRLSQWVHQDNGNIRQLRRMVKNWDAGDGQFRWLLGGPSNRLSRWAWAIKKDLEKGNRLDLVTAYFSPGQGLLRRIAALSKRGGEGRLILAGKTDNAATIGASRLLYGYLLKRKTRIFEFQPKRLHMKLVIVDDAVYIGSANFDLRSLFINVEMMLRIEDRAFAERAREIVNKLETRAEAVTRESHRSRMGFLNRLRWTLAYFVVNSIDYTVTRRLNFGVKK